MKEAMTLPNDEALTTMTNDGTDDAPYVPINWLDHVVERPRTYFPIQNEDGTITLNPETGEVMQQGTPITAANMNHMQNGIMQNAARINQSNVRIEECYAHIEDYAQPKPLRFLNVSVPVSAFVEDDTDEDYPYKVDIALEGALESMDGEVVFSLSDTKNYAGTANVHDGGVTIWAAEIPTQTLVIPKIILHAVDNEETEVTEDGID